MSVEKQSDASAPAATSETARDLDSRLPVQEASYKGWLIHYWKQGEWTAQLFEPGCAEPVADGVVASDEEGEVVLIQRAQRKIDSLAGS